MLAPVTKKRMRRIHLGQSASGPAVRSLARSAAERTRERTVMMMSAERAKLNRIGRWLTHLVLVLVVPSFILTRSLFPAGLNYRRLVPRSDQVQTWVEF
jgi:cytochrome c biogenesis protein ResB